MAGYCSRGVDGEACGDFRPESKYDLSQCRLCWREYHRRGRRIISRPSRKEPCFHLGPVLDRRDRGCGKCWVRQCDVHGRCITGEKVEGIACCALCPDYEV